MVNRAFNGVLQKQVGKATVQQTRLSRGVVVPLRRVRACVVEVVRRVTEQNVADDRVVVSLHDDAIRVTIYHPVAADEVFISRGADTTLVNIAASTVSDVVSDYDGSVGRPDSTHRAIANRVAGYGRRVGTPRDENSPRAVFDRVVSDCAIRGFVDVDAVGIAVSDCVRCDRHERGQSRAIIEASIKGHPEVVVSDCVPRD